MFGKPNYIPEEFLIATRQGWVDKRTGEILVSVLNLDKKLIERGIKINSDGVEAKQKAKREVFDKTTIAPQQFGETPLNKNESKVEPKQDSNESVAELLAQQNSLSIEADFSFGDDVVQETVQDQVQEVDVVEESTTQDEAPQQSLSDLIAPIEDVVEEKQESLTDLIAPIEEEEKQEVVQPKRRGRPKKTS